MARGPLVELVASGDYLNSANRSRHLASNRKLETKHREQSSSRSKGGKHHENSKISGRFEFRQRVLVATKQEKVKWSSLGFIQFAVQHMPTKIREPLEPCGNNEMHDQVALPTFICQGVLGFRELKT